MDILLQDILCFSDDEIARTVIRFNDKNDEGQRPIDDWLKDHNESLNWTYHRNHKFFDNEILVSFFNISPSRYLLVGVDVIHGTSEQLNKISDKSKAGPLDRSCITPYDKYSKYVGRLVIKYNNKVRGGSYSYQKASKGKILPQCYVYEILSEEYSLQKFPGFKNININFNQLQYICFGSGAQDWRDILSTNMGVYLITDTKEKKLYVGSAYGENMLLQRWMTYANTYHGNNKLLKKAFVNGGKEYFEKYMRFSVLEHWSQDEFQNVEFAVSRENHWKEILLSRDANIGNNAN